MPTRAAVSEVASCILVFNSNATEITKEIFEHLLQDRPAFRCERQITTGKQTAGFKVAIRVLKVTFEGRAPTRTAPEGRTLP